LGGIIIAGDAGNSKMSGINYRLTEQKQKTHVIARRPKADVAISHKFPIFIVFTVLHGHLEGIAPQAFPSVTTPVCALARNDIYFSMVR